MLARQLVVWFLAVTVPGMLVLGGVTLHSLASLGSLNDQLTQITLSLSAARDLQFALIAAGGHIDAYLLRGEPRQRAAFERMIGIADQKLAGCGTQSCHGSSHKPAEMARTLAPAVDRLRQEAREIFARSGPFPHDAGDAERIDEAVAGIDRRLDPMSAALLARVSALSVRTRAVDRLTHVLSGSLTIAIALLSCAAAILVASRITSPLRELLLGMRRVMAGDWSYRAGMQGPGEIQELAASFNRMVEEIRRSHEVLSEVSARLIQVAASDMDAALERGLRQVVGFLGVDRGRVDASSDGGPDVHLSCTPPGVEAMPRVRDAGRFPWTAERLGRGEVVRFSRTDELPAEAAVDRASYQRAGTRSHVSLPLRAGGRMLGALSFDAIRGERAWPDELVERLQHLSEAFASALERRRMELALAERLRFEHLVASLADVLGHLSAAEFDPEVQGGLRRVVEFLGVDRGSLIEFSRDGGTARSWANEAWLDLEAYPWMMARLRRGDAVSIARLEEFPDEAAVDRRSYLAQQVKPDVAVPLLAGGTVVGGLVFGAVEAGRAPSEELFERLRAIGEVFAHTLARRQAELEAQRLRQDLAHIGRVSAMGELTASLAHELNQPLTAILSNAQAAERLLGAGVVNLEEIHEILRDIVDDDRRAADVIRGLRGLLKKGDVEFVVLDINEVARDVVLLVRNDALARNVSMSLEMTPDLPGVRGDRVQLGQVLLNLVLNGMEAMQEPHTGARALVIRTAREGTAAVRMSVQDSGIGIDEATRDRMFQPFHTTKPQGLGMGLAIARTIIDAHGGRIGAVSNPDGGATFYFTLPVSAEERR